MAVTMIMSWPGITADDYDTVRADVRWEEDHPDGGIFHVAAFDDGGARITDVWESAEHFQRFVDQRLMPAVARAGITTEPSVEILPAHAVFAPALQHLSA